MGSAAPKRDEFWIAHLLRRAGFSASYQELTRYRSLGYKATLHELLFPDLVHNGTLDAMLAREHYDFSNPSSLKKWWIARMTYSNKPLEEKMTLFWHGHFANSDQKIRDPLAMYRQNQLFRANALGNFESLLLGVSKDPAMIIYLDNQENVKGRPNENYAREVMELFTMGIGNYTEKDIKEGARAFTGWHTKNGAFFFDEKQHDHGVKEFLGRSGDFNGEDIIHTLVKEPATAKYLAKKLITFFAYDNPEPEFIERVAYAYTKSGNQIRPMLEIIFADSSFFSSRAYHAKIKSPVELVVGTVKTLRLNKIDMDLPGTMASMGQNLFEPPSVKGWDGGDAWISSQTMMQRFNFATNITTQKFDELRRELLPSQFAYRQGMKTSTDMVDYFLRLLVDADVPEKTRTRLIEYVSSGTDAKHGSVTADEKMLDAKLRGLVHLIMTLPVYQLS
ncbi:MAG: DUF1800 domain-containing protein [Candidatus Obscuribacterales bacterium]|nr:DUF1800 domain-containing protein [Candidatus Obscuribacterales bacterium]